MLIKYITSNSLSLIFNLDSTALNTEVVTVALARISDYMDLTPVDIVGKRCYQFIHAEDVEGIRQSHLDCEYCTHLTASSTLITQHSHHGRSHRWS